MQSSPVDPNNPVFPPEDQGLDVPKILWRWKWFAMLGAIVGGALGYLQFSREEPTYRSSAMVQVVYPSSDAPGFDSLDAPDQIRGKSRLDESLIIKSARVVDLAIEMSSDLTEHPRFQSMNKLAIRKWILGGRRLEVSPAGRDNSTALIEVGFVCEDPELSRVVVDAVIGGYDHYLEQAYRSLGTEVNRIVTQAQDKLRDAYESLAAKHAKFRSTAPMIWLGDEAQNQWAQNNIEINAAINEINIESQKIQAILQHIAEAQNQSRPADGILVMLSSDPNLRKTLMLDESAVGTVTPSKTLAGRQEDLPFSSSERRRILMELQIREQELLDTVGEQHPAVASVRRRIELLDQQITALVDSEIRIRTENMAADTGDIEIDAMSSEQKLELWKKSLAERIAALYKQELLLRDLATENETKSKELQEYLTRNNLFNSELASLQTLLKVSTDTLNRIQITPDTSRLSLETLTPPATGGFYGPMWMPFILGGAALGFVCVAGLAVLIDWLDQSFRGPQEIAQILGLPILGHIPQMIIDDKTPDADGLDPVLCTFSGVSRAANEAIRAIRTNLYFSENGQSNRVIQLTSPAPGDGKSTLAANLAISMAQSGRSVLLIDADMRRPRIAKLFGLNDTEGVGEVIIGESTLASAIVSTPVKNLSVLASTQPSANPSELVSHQRFQDFLSEVRAMYDYVIIDTPPVLAVADACAVAARVDGVIVTLRLRRDAKPTAKEAANTLQAVGARVLGVVVNGVAGTEGYAYGYRGYGYGGIDDEYAEEEGEVARDNGMFLNQPSTPNPNIPVPNMTRSINSANVEN